MMYGDAIAIYKVSKIPEKDIEKIVIFYPILGNTLIYF